MEEFKNAKIYKIVDNTTGKIYIGSTCKSLEERLYYHKSTYKRYLNEKYCFVTSFNILQNENYNIILLEECDNITSKEELRMRERYYIENNECVNKLIPTRTGKEYYIDNKEKIKEYRKDNREHHKEYMKEYMKNNKDIIKEKNKEYRKDNREKIKEYMKEYYDDNKLTIKENNKEKLTCNLCNSQITKCNLARHNKSIKHQQALTEKF